MHQEVACSSEWVRRKIGHASEEAAVKLAGRSTTGWFVRIFVLLLIAALNLYADVIYLNNGSVLLVEKAWEEGEEVKYRSSKGIQSLPKSSVRSIRQEKPAPPPTVQRWGTAVGKGSPSGTDFTAPVPAVSSASGAPVSQESLARLRDNLKADPSDAIGRAELVRALNSVASLQVAQGDLTSAQSSLEEALRLDKNNSALLSNLATIFFRLGNYHRAEDVLLACLQVDSQNQWIHYFLGEVYYKQEKISQAISQWNEALRLGPNEAIAERLEKARRESGVHNELSALKSTHFILRYDRKTSNLPLGEQILATLEDLYRRLSRELTPHAPDTVAVILYPDQAFFDITRAPGWAGGVYDGKIRIPIRGLYSVTSELKAALAHELTHCFMTGLPGRGSPTWFLEGVAQVQEGRSAAEERKVLVQLQRANSLIPLRNLRGSFIGLPGGMVDVAYAESLSAVEYLTARFGRSAIRDLLDLMAQNYNFENAFNKVLQRSVSEFETAWQRDLTQ
jgi:tetratricopeptide (TPR) repeat protein